MKQKAPIFFSTLLLLFVFQSGSAETPKYPVKVAGVPAVAWASSELKGKIPGMYSPAKAFDGDLKTAWAEGVEGLGERQEENGKIVKEGEWIAVEFKDSVQISAVQLNLGFQKSEELYNENLVPTVVLLNFDNDTATVFLSSHSDTLWYKDEGSSNIEYLPNLEFKSIKVILLARPKKIHFFKLTILYTSYGATPFLKYYDDCISEISLLRETDPTVAYLRKYPKKSFDFDTNRIGNEMDNYFGIGGKCQMIEDTSNHCLKTDLNLARAAPCFIEIIKNRLTPAVTTKEENVAIFELNQQYNALIQYFHVIEFGIRPIVYLQRVFNVKANREYFAFGECPYELQWPEFRYHPELCK